MPSPSRSTPIGTKVALGVMLLLQYAVWGVWLPYLANYLQASHDKGGLGFSTSQIGIILGVALSLGAVTAPFIAGQVADRYLNAEKALGLLLLVGGVLNFVLAYQHAFVPFLGIAVLYSISYMPTLSLTNSVSFQNLREPEREFPPVRMSGTVGWIAASALFPLLWLNTKDPVVNTARVADALRVSGVLSVVYAVFCLVALPKTPPKRSAEPLAFAKAFALLEHRGFLVVTLVALPIAVIHQAYFFNVSLFLEHQVQISLKWIGLVLSLGQWSEMFFLAILGLLIKRMGFRGVLALGAAAYAGRYIIFAFAHPAGLVVAAQALHGLCYGCFFAGAYLYVERVAPKDVRHSAQTVFGIIILGIGPVLAGPYNAYFAKWSGKFNFTPFWWVQAITALVALAALMIFFPSKNADASPDDVTLAEEERNMQVESV